MMDAPAAPPDTRSAPTVPRPRSRGLGWAVVRAAFLAGLGALTYANATRSPALTEAVDAEARGDYPTALRAATEHLEHRPWSREAGRVVARCLSRLDFAEQAEPYYQRAGDLSVADLRYRAYGLTRANLRERALRAFDEVLAREPDDVASLRLKAGVLLSMSRPNDASEPLDLAAGPGSRVLVGVSRWGDVAEVGRRLSGLRRRPTEVEAPVAVGGHWTFRPSEIACVPAIGATLEAMAAHNQGDPGGAVEASERVLAIDPGLRSMPLERRDFWAQFGQDLLAVGRSSDAVRLLGGAEEGRSDPGIVTLLARAHAQLGEVDEAEACWRRVIELAPGQAPAWLGLGQIESARGNPGEAARLLARAAELAPDSVDAAYNLGLACRKLGRADEARKWEREAARLLALREEKRRARNQPPASTSPPPAS